MPDRPPPMPTGDDEEALFMQYVLRQSQRQFIDTPTVKFHVDRNSIRAHAAPKAGGIGRAGWRWAEPKEYDPDTQYAVNEVVVVSPHNLANTTGVSNVYGGGGVDPEDGGALFGVDGFGENGDKATAGTWVCVKPPKVLYGLQPGDPDAPRNYNVHVPVWTLPDGDPDSVANFWLLVGLYPETINLCVDGVSTPYYMQAQPVPEEFITGEGGETMTGEGGEGLTPE